MSYSYILIRSKELRSYILKDDGLLKSLLQVGKKTFAITEIMISATANTTSSSGLILTPSVSSSKNLSSPALAAGIGLLSFFFLLMVFTFLQTQQTGSYNFAVLLMLRILKSQ